MDRGRLCVLGKSGVCGGGWRGVGWAAVQFGYMLALAYGGALLVYRAGSALGFGGGG